MTKVRHRYLYKESGAMRSAAEYEFDPRDLDKDGKPPAWFHAPQSIKADDDEVEFDRPVTMVEITLAFQKRSDANGGGKAE